jgi:hypothetical protein
MELDETKAEIYADLAVFNRAFQQIIGAMARLEAKGMVSADYLQDQEIVTRDLWARINCQILAGVTQHETDDRTHYGEMRATLERRIRGRQ